VAAAGVKVSCEGGGESFAFNVDRREEWEGGNRIRTKEYAAEEELEVGLSKKSGGRDDVLERKERV